MRSAISRARGSSARRSAEKTPCFAARRLPGSAGARVSGCPFGLRITPQSCRARRTFHPLSKTADLPPRSATASTEKALYPAPLRSPLTDSNRRPPPYHGGAPEAGGTRAGACLRTAPGGEGGGTCLFERLP